MKKDHSKSITHIESYGIEEIPTYARTATPFDLFRLSFGGANTFSTCVLGSFPIVFGLSFQAGLWAILCGVLFGACILAPMGVFGARTGTNNAVASGAHFGIHGRIVGSFLSLLTAIAFFSLSVWSSGDALIGATQRLFDRSYQNNWVYGLVYSGFALLVLIICIYGFRFMLLVNRIAVITSSLLFFLGLFAFAQQFDSAYAGQIQLGETGFWAAFTGAALIAFSNPISFGTFLGGWSRYIPKETSSYKIMLAVFTSQLATLIPFLFGLMTATIVANHVPIFMQQNNYIGGLIHIAPTWYFFPLCLIALIGGLSTGTTALYGTGLDMSSIFPKLLSRVKATICVGVLSILFIFIGRFLANLTQSVTTFATLIVVCTSPWIIIMIIGFVSRRGYYKNDDLQVFATGIKGGVYWFHHGWNWRGLIAWIPSAFIGLCFVHLPHQFVGIWGNFFNGLDLSLPISIILAALLYTLLLKFFPEPSSVYSPTLTAQSAKQQSNPSLVSD
ncbi:cytosine permease [Acinetobacter sp. NRRL B-65365]|uniref:purine-cytosine permease family protein n=1 Tax=Acinetobacter sp. NRRL B-65365 TaxID=1785092 RepID=UPI0007A036F5|nr:cytosine permease [Acinetobacter sp. NRRL B-65365]KYQ83456.1 cytosine permease [Acinetobacter sp. NRRL B-65365]